MNPIKVDPRFPFAMMVINPIASMVSDYRVTPDTSGNLMLTAWNLPGDPPTDDQVTTALATYEWQQFQANTVQPLLDASDTTALRCFKAAVPFPSEWQTYVTGLRALMHAASGDPTASVPTRPAYPAGT